MTAYATVDTAVEAMKLGAYDYLVKPFDPEELSLMIQKIVTQQALVRENVLLRKVLKREYQFRDLISKSPAMQAVFDLARTAARSDSTILILGESGTGKELLARAIHAESPRSQGPFVAVSCAALTETLLESELFGHEKGAFTGRRRPPQGQVRDGAGRHAVPRRDRRHQPEAATRPAARAGGPAVLPRGRHPSRSRSMSASSPPPTATCRRPSPTAAFREDLFYRLNVIPVHLPPLRERLEDLPLLVDHFLEQLGAEMNRHVDEVSSEAMSTLMAHHWPGNVRELRNVLERAIVVATGRVIQVADLGLRRPAPEDAGIGPLASLDEVEKHHIALVLADCGGNISQAARTLGIDRATLYNKMKKYQLRKDGEAEPEEHATT